MSSSLRHLLHLHRLCYPGLTVVPCNDIELLLSMLGSHFIFDRERVPTVNAHPTTGNLFMAQCLISDLLILLTLNAQVGKPWPRALDCSSQLKCDGRLTNQGACHTSSSEMQAKCQKQQSAEQSKAHVSEVRVSGITNVRMQMNVDSVFMRGC